MFGEMVIRLGLSKSLRLDGRLQAFEKLDHLLDWCCLVPVARAGLHHKVEVRVVLEVLEDAECLNEN